MKFLSFILLASTAAAAPLAALRPYVAPKSADSRSPCPFLNTLANHGYLPHNGRNINVTMLGDAMINSINWDRAFGEGAGQTVLADLGQTTLDLEDLNTPQGTEHVASLTRLDAGQGDPVRLNTGRLNAFLADSTSRYITVESAAKSRVRIEKLTKPELITPAVTGVGTAEAALMMLLLADNLPTAPTATTDYSNVRAPKDRVKAWFVDEKFPTTYGFKQSATFVPISNLSPLISAIAAKQAILAI